MTARHDGVGHPLRGQPGELMADDRGPRAGDLDHRLRTVVGVRAKPRPLAARQDHGLRRIRMHAVNDMRGGQGGGGQLPAVCWDTPYANDVSQTGREKDCARVGP